MTKMISHCSAAVFLFLFACSNAPQQPDVAAVAEPAKPVMAAPAAPVAPAAEIAPAPVPKKEKPAPAPKAAKAVPIGQTVPATPVAQTAAPVVTSKLTGGPVSHLALDSLLQKHVNSAGTVNYKGLKNDKVALDAYCQLLSDNPVQDDWSRETKMAYWINAYNAFTLKLIVDNYPTKSILNFDGGKTWDVRRIRLGDKKYSLNNLENDILRPQFKDPRIHFAINCAAKSCPPLWNHAYSAENLESTLETRARAFINNPDYNTLSAKSAQVSKIFDWYGVDFGGLRVFLNKYADKALDSNAAIRFNEYDWNLNE
jgi:hypothetical protein